MQPRWSYSLALVSALTVAPALADAHISLQQPPPRSSSQKAGPCGSSGSVRDPAKVHIYEPGTPFTVEWDETVDHDSHYRIAFDLDGQDFVNPPDYMDFSVTDGVLADDIADRDGGGHYTQDITWPNQECDNCTLQLIQVMYGSPPLTDSDIYHQCADITLKVGGDPNPDPDPGDDTTDDGGGCDAGHRHGGGAAIVAFGLVAPLARRRRRQLAR